MGLGRKVITRKNARRAVTALCRRNLCGARNVPNFYWVNNSRYYNPFCPISSFIHAEELRSNIPVCPQGKGRTNSLPVQGGFYPGIGGALGMERFDDRSPDYDDWSTEAEDGSVGLNGDIIVWNPVLQSAFEISSMGDPGWIGLPWKNNCGWKCRGPEKLYFHSLLLEGNYPKQWGENRTIPALYALIAEMSYRRGTSRLMARWGIDRMRKKPGCFCF